MTVPDAAYPCAACGHLVFAEPPGSYAVCDACGWEDDHVQLRFPGSPVGANGVSLFEYQRTVAPARLAANAERVRGLRRAAGWRPLRDDEARTDAGAPTSGREYFEAVGGDAPRYYWEA